MAIRSFLAFEIPPEIRDTLALIYNGLRETALNVRWVKQENIHITVIFMGNVDEKNIVPMAKVLEKACNKYAPFMIRIKGAGVFSNLRNPRVLWIGVDGDIKRMRYFRDRLQKDLKAFGIKEEKRRFTPHLTVGRFKRGFNQGAKLKELIEKYRDIASADAMLKELVLFKSELRPEGAIYTKLNSWPLQGKK
ncbi:MAG: RNA 2',3'-cyclic phosphodiesterase [Deltaproteobacteria bacterium]|nr:MAG: RNA 2',3'-cyclic phosphodiesterase [Deltaproteobacteria bacterium]